LEEQVRGVGLERQIAEFVDDQQLRLGEETEPMAARATSKKQTADQPSSSQARLAPAEPTAPPTNIPAMKIVLSRLRAPGLSA
jgi:hypothetical protein